MCVQMHSDILDILGGITIFLKNFKNSMEYTVSNDFKNNIQWVL